MAIFRGVTAGELMAVLKCVDKDALVICQFEDGDHDCVIMIPA